MDRFVGKKLVILGLARQGSALARFAVQAGASVVVSDLGKPEQLQASLADLADLPIEFLLGNHPLTLLDGTDFLAISGGVPNDIPLVQTARERGITITNDSLEFMKRTPAKVIGITGSAGKTTTTALTGAIGQAAKRQTWVGGNIGRPLIAELANMQPDDMVVQELSSFQLELWDQSPAIAAVTNITPNHLDRHKTMAAYTEAKANILRFQSAQDVAVLCADDAGAMALAPLVNGRLRQFSIQKAVTDGAFLRDDTIWLSAGDGNETAVCTLADIHLRGQHNILNVCAAVTLAATAGIPVPAMVTAIRDFNGVAHRLEQVATINGVEFINDSIATAPERALAAINAFSEPLILLAGGKDKAMVWETWAQRVQERVKTVILFGALADLLAEKLEAADEHKGLLQKIIQVDSLAEAVMVGMETAVAGDIILLSPGGTSYDAYIDFAARGQEFRDLVNDLQQQTKKHSKDTQKNAMPSVVQKITATKVGQ